MSARVSLRLYSSSVLSIRSLFWERVDFSSIFYLTLHQHMLARYNYAYCGANHLERYYVPYLTGKQCLKILPKVIQQASGRVDHKVNFIQPLVQFLTVNHHLNSARKVPIHFTPCFNPTNGVDTRFTQTAWTHTSRLSYMRLTSLGSTHSERGLWALCSNTKKEARTSMLLLLPKLSLVRHSTIPFWFYLYF